MLKKSTRQRSSLLSVLFLTLSKELQIAECFIFDTRKELQRSSLPSVKNKTLGKELLCRVFLLPRVFCLALGKEPNSGSESFSKRFEIKCLLIMTSSIYKEYLSKINK
jgi:hypothetical protein